jgi:hypothetical protein
MNDVLTHADINNSEKLNLVKGMNYRPNGKEYSIFIMSVNDDAPYNDGFDEEGKVLTYEGHDINKRENIKPKSTDQTMFTRSGKLSENGIFFKLAEDYKNRRIGRPEKIRVYEKIKANVWSDKGFFYLVDADYLYSRTEDRKVFKFRLIPEEDHTNTEEDAEKYFSRRIPTVVKRIVWERDNGKCAVCGSTQDLHFDHILP